MSTIHTALKALAPIDYSTVPTESEALKKFLQEHLGYATLLADSVPPPPPPPTGAGASNQGGRARANTADAASKETGNASGEHTPTGLSASTGNLSSSTLISSSARTEAPSPATTAMQTEWGKPLKLNLKEKDNPLDISVYKLAARDARGAWFSRRSVHEGLSFSRWRDALKSEFTTSLAVQGAPGEGNVRGIGADVRLEQTGVEGTGNLDVYHLSAQFPGPTAPRDFVELLITSPNEPEPAETKTLSPKLGPQKQRQPRTYIVISKPCAHPDAELRPGFTRGAYESIEMIREVPRRKRNSVSAVDLKSLAADHRAQLNLARDSLIRRAQAKSSGSSESVPDSPRGASRSTEDVSADEPPSPRVKGFSLTPRRSSMSNRDRPDLDADPVEWIQITRSDPGGSVPRFMVERGTPAGIVGDAAKFIDWVGSNALTVTASSPADTRSRPSLDEIALPSRSSTSLPPELDLSNAKEPLTASDPGPGSGPEGYSREGIFSMASSVAQLAKSRLGEYAPMLTNSLAATFQRPDDEATASQTSSPTDLRHMQTAPSLPSSASSTSSAASFASALPSPRAASPAPGSKEAQLVSAHSARLAQLDAALESSRQKYAADPKRLEKETARHAKAREKAEAAHRKAMAGADAARRKNERKQLERQARDLRREREREMKDERSGLRAEVKGLKDEVKALQEVIRRLREENGRVDEVLRRVQAENTTLVARVGALPGGDALIEELKLGGSGSISVSGASAATTTENKENEGASVKSASGKSGMSEKSNGKKSIESKEK